MSKIEMLRLLINQRLTEAAEEIFGVFGRTIAEYEEEISRSKLEIDRQRRLLDLSLKPQISLQLNNAAAVEEQQEWSSGQLSNEANSPHIKEEEVEVWPPQQEERRPSSQPADDKSALYPGSISKDESDRNRTTSNFPRQDTDDPEPDPRLGPSVQQACSASDSDAPEAPHPTLGNREPDSMDLEVPLSEVVDSYICTICGRAFAQRGHWAKHVQVHRKVETKYDKSYTCDICGKRLTRFDGYQKHLRIHTGEKPYSCSECGRRFSDNSNYKRHIRTHTGQKMQS